MHAARQYASADIVIPDFSFCSPSAPRTLAGVSRIGSSTESRFANPASDLVETMGVEPTTSAMRVRRSPS